MTQREQDRFSFIGPAAAVALAAFAALAVSLGDLRALGTYNNSRIVGLPPTILWAWERPEQFDFIDPRSVGVAFLAQTLNLSGEDVAARPRLQPLTVPAGTAVIAVTRVETDPRRRPTFSAEQIHWAAESIAKLALLPGVRAVQVDFDATASERAFYKSLLVEIRKRLPDSTALSMTALASWCLGDNWVEGLPVDEAVPMLFRMGADHHEVLHRLESGRDFQAPACRSSLGLSTEEPISAFPRGRRVFLFHPRAWSRAAFEEAIRQVTP
jgi:hypothetical protein